MAEAGEEQRWGHSRQMEADSPSRPVHSNPGKDVSAQTTWEMPLETTAGNRSGAQGKSARSGPQTWTISTWKYF